MADYAIGDVQGCFEPLMRLIAKIQFNPEVDRLWFVGDLVNRGPESLAVLRWISQLAIPPIVTLGNHDLYLLVRLFMDEGWKASDDTLDEVVCAPDAEALGHWLRSQPLLYHDAQLGIVMSHAGVAPMWTLEAAKQHAKEVETVLRGQAFKTLLSHLYGNQPDLWQDTLTGFDRLRCIVNYFTRMRYCDAQGRMYAEEKGPIEQVQEGLIPWYAHPMRAPISETLVFGHWASLRQVCPTPRVYALDTGCVWGESLTALRLQDKQLFSVESKA